MSVKISGKVWELDIDPMDKLVLLALADHADHEGENVRPGHALLSAKTGLSEKTIGVKIDRFVELGWLEIAENEQGGRGKKRGYAIDLEQAPRRPYFIERDRERAAKRAKLLRPLTPRKGEAASPFNTTEKGEVGDLKGEAGDLKGEVDGNSHDKDARARNRHEPSHEPSWAEDARARAKTATTTPPPPPDTPTKSAKSRHSLETLESYLIYKNGAAYPGLLGQLYDTGGDDDKVDFFLRRIAEKRQAKSAAAVAEWQDPLGAVSVEWRVAIEWLLNQGALSYDTIVTWFAPLQVTLTEERPVQIRAPDAAFAEFLCANYTAELQRALQIIGGSGEFEIIT